MGNGPNQFLFLGHIDTVPGEIPVRIEEDKLFGRGSVDAKGPLSAFVDAVARVGEIPGWSFIVVGAVDEEGDSKGARKLASDFSPVMAIIGEPSQWDRIVLGYKGSANFEISVKKTLAHSARVETNACEALVNFWVKLTAITEEFNQVYSKHFSRIQPSIHSFCSEQNDFDEWAKMTIKTRLPPDVSPQTWYEMVRGILEEAELTETGYPVPAFIAKKNNLLVRSFLRSIRSQQGDPAFVYKTGTSDANVVAPIWECPMVVYGPGDSNLDHTPEEHIPIQDYLKSVNVLEAVIKSVVDAD